MARLAAQIPAIDATQDHQREVGVLIMLVAVPVIWAALLTAMMGVTLAAVGAAVGLAGLAGMGVGFGREYYLAHIDQQHLHH